MAVATTSGQIPLHHPVVGADGRMTQQWAFWLQNFAQNQPPAGSGYVIDGSAGTYGALTIFQGTAGDRSLTPAKGAVYLALDTGDIYVEEGGTWTLHAGALTGDVTTQAGSNVTTLKNSNTTPGTYGSEVTIPVLTVNSKGLVTSSTEVPLVIPDRTAQAAGTDEDIQFNLGGSLATDTGVFTYDDLSTTLKVGATSLNGDGELETPSLDVQVLQLKVNGDPGLNRQVLTSRGTTAPPQWSGPFVIDVPFQHGVVSPFPLYTVPAGVLVKAVHVYLEEEYTGTGASLEVTTPTGPLLSMSDIDPYSPATYQTSPTTSYQVNTPVSLTSSAGSSTQGRGIISLTLQVI